MHRSIILLAGATALATVATPALGEPNSARIMVYMSDFASPHARAALDRRVDAAAEELCGVNAVAEGVSWGELKKCRADMRQQVYQQIASMNAADGVRLSAR